MTATSKMPATREEAVEKFRIWIAQKPGLDPRNYYSDPGDTSGIRSYVREAENIAKQGHRARKALKEFETLAYDPEALEAEMRHSFSGRLQFNQKGDLEYCTGQYWPTEYRIAAAVCLEAYNNVMRPRIRGNETLIRTMEDFIALHKHNAGHFFDADTMRFFRSRIISQNLIRGKDGQHYFITSEQFVDSSGKAWPLEFRIRIAYIATGEVRGDVKPPEGETFRTLTEARKYIKDYLI